MRFGTGLGVPGALDTTGDSTASIEVISPPSPGAVARVRLQIDYPRIPFKLEQLPGWKAFLLKLSALGAHMNFAP